MKPEVPAKSTGQMEIEVLRQKVTDLILNKTEKAAKIVTYWIHEKAQPQVKKKKAA